MNLKTEMRRAEKAITDLDYIKSIMEKAPFGILSLCKEGLPYALPVNFYYGDGTLYIHCAKEGQKVQYIQANPQVCFLIVHPTDVSETECSSAMNYESILCFGRAVFSETSSIDVLEKLGAKYNECSEITEVDCQETAIIAVHIDEVSAKRGYSLKSG